jgi:hypothetical protein
LPVARTVESLRASGLAIERDNHPVCTSQLVAQFTDKSSATFCDVEKHPDPRMRDHPQTIFSGKNASGKGAEVVFLNVDCVLYGSSSMNRERAVSATIAAMRRLGGTKIASY